MAFVVQINLVRVCAPATAVDTCHVPRVHATNPVPAVAPRSHHHSPGCACLSNSHLIFCTSECSSLSKLFPVPPRRNLSLAPPARLPVPSAPNASQNSPSPTTTTNINNNKTETRDYTRAFLGASRSTASSSGPWTPTASRGDTPAPATLPTSSTTSCGI